MLTYTEAIGLIGEEAKPLSKVVLQLSELLGHALCDPLVAPFDMPQFDNSQVDGYGVKVEDLTRAKGGQPVRLNLIGTLKAGGAVQYELKNGQAVKIFTGGPVPSSVEAIVMKEYCCEKESLVEIEKLVSPGENIRRSGGEFRKGEELLAKGTLITPPVIGLLATLGYSHATVFAKPKLALVATGDELVEPGQELLPGQIYDANSYALQACARGLALEASVTLVKDEYALVENALREALKKADVIITSGGVSVGEFDFVKTSLEALGVKTLFWKVAIKPGKPLYFGVAENDSRRQLIFGLPGNTVSTLVTFHQFVKPALKLMMGVSEPALSNLSAHLKTSAQKHDPRLDFLRGKLEAEESGKLTALPTKGQQSHMLSGLAKANCLIHFPLDCDNLSEGASVTVDLLKWFD